VKAGCGTSVVKESSSTVLMRNPVGMDGFVTVVVSNGTDCRRKLPNTENLKIG